MEGFILGLLFKSSGNIRRGDLRIHYYEIFNASAFQQAWFTNNCLKVDWVEETGITTLFNYPPPSANGCMVYYSFYCEPCNQDEQTVINRTVKITSAMTKEKMCKKWCGSRWEDFER